MNQESREVLEEKVKELTVKMSELEPGSKEFESTVKAINDLAARVNDSLRIDLDYDEKVCSSEREVALKKEQFEQEMAFKKTELEARISDEKARRNNSLIIEGGKAFVEIFGVVVPLAAYWEFMKAGFKFEQTNIVSSATFRNLLRFVKPRK